MKNLDTMYYVAFYAHDRTGQRKRFDFKVSSQAAANALAKKFNSPFYYFGIKGAFSSQYKTI